MAQTKNLCAQIPLELHVRICEEKEEAGQSMNEYMTDLLTEYFTMKDSKTNGGRTMEKTRTMAFQVPEEFFQRIKRYLNAHQGLTQKDFIVGLVDQALTEWEEAAATASEQHTDGDGGGGEDTEDAEGSEETEDIQDSEEAQDNEETQDSEHV